MRTKLLWLLLGAVLYASFSMLWLFVNDPMFDSWMHSIFVTIK